MAETIKTGLQWREATITRMHDDEGGENKISLSFSSEAPVERFFGEIGDEILDHRAESVDMGFMGAGKAPLLLDHDPAQVVGVVESATINSGERRGEAVARFSRSEQAQAILADVRDGIRANVSVGYRVNEVEREKGDNGRNVFRVTDWTPLEISLVSIPADMSVGVGRSDEFETKLTFEKVETMTEEVKNETRAAASAAPQVDMDAVRADAMAAAAKNVAEINALGARHNMQDFASEHIAKGTDVAEFRGLMLDKISDAKPLDAVAGEVGLKEDEKREYSLIRAINAAASNDWRNAGFEREMSEEIAQRTGKDAKGFYVPMDVMGQRDLTAGTATAGGNLVGTDHLGGDFIDALRARMVTAEAGARIMSGLQGNVTIPALNAKTSTYWVAENGAPTEGAPTFRQVSMTPKTVGAYVDMSRQLLQQSDPSVEAVVRGDIVNQIAQAIDIAAIQGADGGNDPTGVLNTTGIGDVAIGTNGGAATWAKVLDVLKAVDSSNALMGSLAFIGSPSVKSHLMQKVRVASTDSRFIMESVNELLGYRYLNTTNSPDNLTKGTLSGAASSLLFGNFNDLLIGSWGGLDVQVDPYSLGTTGAVRLTAFNDADVAVRHVESFAAIQDIDTTA